MQGVQNGGKRQRICFHDVLGGRGENWNGDVTSKAGEGIFTRCHEDRYDTKRSIEPITTYKYL